MAAYDFYQKANIPQYDFSGERDRIAKQQALDAARQRANKPNKFDLKGHDRYANWSANTYDLADRAFSDGQVIDSNGMKQDVYNKRVGGVGQSTMVSGKVIDEILPELNKVDSPYNIDANRDIIEKNRLATRVVKGSAPVGEDGDIYHYIDLDEYKANFPEAYEANKDEILETPSGIAIPAEAVPYWLVDYDDFATKEDMESLYDIYTDGVSQNTFQQKYYGEKGEGERTKEQNLQDFLDLRETEILKKYPNVNQDWLRQSRDTAAQNLRSQYFKPEKEDDKEHTYRGYGWSRKPTQKETPFIDAMLNTKPDPNGNVQIDVENLKSGVKEETVTVWEEVEKKYVPVKYVYIGENGDVTVKTNSGKVIGGMPARNAVNQSFGVLWQEWKPQVDKEQKNQTGATTSENIKSKNNSTPEVGKVSDLPD